MNMGVIGCGVMGALHTEIAHRCGVEIVACMDTLAPRAEALARVHDARPYTDLTSFFSDARIEIVAVASPTNVHAEHIHAACDSGKHIFCETPLARTHADAKSVAAAAAGAGVKLFAGHTMRYFHAIETLAAQAQLDKIGAAGFVKTYRAGPCPRGQGDWYRDFEQSGGVVLDGLVHDFDWLRSSFGAIESVYCRRVERAEPAVMGYATATCTFESGLIAQSIGSWAHAAGHRVAIELVGEHGIALYDSADAPIHVMPRGAAPGSVTASSPTAPGPYERAWREFIAWIEHDTTPRVTAEDAVAALRVAEAALGSSMANEPVVV